MPSSLQLVARTGYPDFLDLPWERPLAEWERTLTVEVMRGVHRHVVRFVEAEGLLFALKELPRHLAEREYRLLGHLESEAVPVVDVVGYVHDRGEDLDAVLITRHLEFSVPYRFLFSRRGSDELRPQLLNALAGLLTRLHLAGFFWGDCSLSNALFRRDAGALTAYLVDAETAEVHPTLTDGQRSHDLQIAETNVAGELFDVMAELGIAPEELDPVETALELRRRYEDLWSELTAEDVFSPDERHRVNDRLARLNDLGFDVNEIELVATDGGFRLHLDPHVVEAGHHQRHLFALTGLRAQENQARRMLNDLHTFKAGLEAEAGRSLPDSAAAFQWRSSVFEPVIAVIPPELFDRREPAEVFHEVLQHRWFMSERAGRDVGLLQATDAYVEDVLRFATLERAVIRPASEPST